MLFVSVMAIVLARRGHANRRILALMALVCAFVPGFTGWRMKGFVRQHYERLVSPESVRANQELHDGLLAEGYQEADWCLEIGVYSSILPLLFGVWSVVLALKPDPAETSEDTKN